jgi:hypothetical protein
LPLKNSANSSSSDVKKFVEPGPKTARIVQVAKLPIASSSAAQSAICKSNAVNLSKNKTSKKSNLTQQLQVSNSKYYKSFKGRNSSEGTGILMIFWISD